MPNEEPTIRGVAEPRVDNSADPIWSGIWSGMGRDEFINEIRRTPNDDSIRFALASWFESQNERTPAARMRWWCEVRSKLRSAFRLDSAQVDILGSYAPTGDLRQLIAALASADDWRWRLGCLEAVRGGEGIFLPWMEPAPWPEGWSSDRFLSVLHECRCTLELWSLGVLPEGCNVARVTADEAVTAAQALVDSAAEDIDKLGPWVQACEVLHMAERTVALTRDWTTWDETMSSEGGIAGELKQFSIAACEMLLAQPMPLE